MSKTIAILALPGVQLLDVAGPLDVFAQANRETNKTAYSLKVIAITSGPIHTSSGVKIQPDLVMTEANEPFDTLLIAGGPSAKGASLPRKTIEWLVRTTALGRRYGSVCTGAFYLASTGLLQGRHITTHWAAADELAKQYPSIRIDKDALYVKDGKLRTAAGVTAGMDLALALVEEDLGRDIALRVSEQLVMYFKRPGGQLQFSRKDEKLPAVRSVLQEIQRWVAANPGLEHSIATLAKRAGMSPRHFSRIFNTEVGMSPAAWVEATRVEAAKTLLQNGHDTPKSVAFKCGFVNVDTLRRTFKKYVGLTPAEFRRHYPLSPDVVHVPKKL
jgi:transcriptional regulator GlxA family with amidase domain